MTRAGFPVGASVTRERLDADLHAVLRELRASEPVSWIPALGGWLVTSRAAALRVLRDSGVFTVDDPRFTTARVVGPSMLSLDGAAHRRHREPFAEAFRVEETRGALSDFVSGQADALARAVAADGRAEVRRQLAGPLAVAVVARVLGLRETDPAMILRWYDAIVAGVTGLAAGEPGAPPAAAAAGAFGELAASLRAVISRPDGDSLLAASAGGGRLSTAETVSNAAVLMFGGIETTEGMICNALLYLLSDPGQLAEVTADPGLVAVAVEESLRLEPAAAVVDRYATAGIELAGAPVRSGDLVTVSLAGANRDPAVFADPDRFDVRRSNARQHLAFAHGPHFCVGAHLARLEAVAAVTALLRLPGLRLDPDRPATPSGVVFRKPGDLYVRWNGSGR